MIVPRRDPASGPAWACQTAETIAKLTAIADKAFVIFIFVSLLTLLSFIDI